MRVELDRPAAGPDLSIGLMGPLDSLAEARKEAQADDDQVVRQIGPVPEIACRTCAVFEAAADIINNFCSLDGASPR